MKLKNFDFRIWNEKYGCYITNSRENPICVASDNTLDNANKGYKILSLDFAPYDTMPLVNEDTKEEDYEIELFTGFKDKNGKKIYDGDILQRDEMKYQVRYVEEESGFEIVELRVEGATFFVSEICNELEIIGNIHKNPELLGY